MRAIGRVAQLWRYPVKSMHGESLTSLELVKNGVTGDRRYAFESSGAPPGMLRVTGAERRRLLLHHAVTDPETGRVSVIAPEGRGMAIDDAALALHLAGASNVLSLTESDVPQTDVRPLSLLSLQSVAHLERELGQPLGARRFRANLLLDLDLPAQTMPEDSLTGHTIALGSALVQVLERDPRCRFITLDPDTAAPLPELMKLLHDRHQGRVGVYGKVVRPGGVRAGDAVYLV